MQLDARLARVSAPMGRVGNVYILTGRKSFQIEGAEDLFLLRIQTRESTLGFGVASQVAVFGRLSRVVVRDFFDLL